MHYYQFNIGNYRRETVHLTLTEHAIYRALIDTYYLTEKPLCADKAVLMRSVCVRSADEKEAFENVLADFFALTDDGYRHEDCENLISKYQAKSNKARESAQKRWGNNANALQTDSEGNANQEPITNNQEKTFTSSGDDCPHEKIISLYHEKLPTLPRIKVWSDKRRKALRARWREDKERQTVDWWGSLFDYVADSDFLMGRSGDWSADLEWIINSSNLVKIIEGKYENRGGGSYE